ncbi:MAG: ATP-binding protein [Candidatus Aenigmarchaeota archaeon]|nr:ATP-binding protein [Candidatus Aenigmarchaeota archaeon]
MEEILIVLNEWWETKSISGEKAKDYERKAFSRIRETFFGYRQILVLNGLRRVGKTTIMFQLIGELLKKDTSPRHILYFSFDEAVENPLAVLEAYSKITKIDWKKERIFLFFDEIQKLKDWSSKIKILYDNFPNLKICISGSASLMIKKEAIGDLAGRYFSEYIPPLTLQEFAELSFGKTVENFELHELDLKRIFDDYARKPFPEIVKWDDRAKVNSYIRELVIEKIIKSDVPEAFENVNSALLSSLTEIFMKDVGMILDVTSLSKELGVHKLTLMKHIGFLEFGNLFRVVKNFRPSIRAESRKLKKIYPAHISLAFCFYPKLAGGQIYECLVCSALNLKRYWREGRKEIDFLMTGDKTTPIEVKEKDSINKKDVKNLLIFLKKYDLHEGIVVYSGKEGRLAMKGKTIVLQPIQKLLFCPTPAD